MANYTEIVQIIIPSLTITHDYVSTITLHNPTNLTATIDRPKISFTAFNTRQKIFFTLTKDILLPAMIVEVVTENLSVDIMSPNRFLYLSQLLTCPSTICKEETRTTTTTTTTACFNNWINTSSGAPGVWSVVAYRPGGPVTFYAPGGVTLYYDRSFVGNGLAGENNIFTELRVGDRVVISSQYYPDDPRLGEYDISRIQRVTSLAGLSTVERDVHHLSCPPSRADNDPPWYPQLSKVVTMEMVEVARFLGNNDKGINQADTTGYGQVLTAGAGGIGYSYKIGKYEVTGSQYAAFLNAIAKTDAAYGLYNANMGSDSNSYGYAQISRLGAPGSYTYEVMKNTGQRPITYVSWFDCARFCNWMSNGQPRGDQTTRTTENGAYNLNGATSGSAIVSNSINPNPGAGATYRVPNENEWYKAAYYKGGNSNTAGYWTYPTQSNNQPGTTIGVNPNQVNYANAFRRAIDVGSFSGSASTYGTFDQGGNVSEWNDLDNTVGPTRGIRGGNWADGSAVSSSARYVEDPSYEASSLGFRIVRYS